jgi:predicted porin
MQKKIIALAVVAAAFSAPAFADVTLYGLVDVAAASISGDGQKSDLLAVSGGLSTSRLGFKASEDVGGGLKAIAVLEYKIDAGTKAGTSLADNARQQLVGVAGDFGTIAAGYLQTTGYDFDVSFDPTAGSTISPLGNLTKGGGFIIGTVAAGARATHALAYISPKISGFTIAVNQSTSFNDNGNGDLGKASNATALKTSATLASVNYAAGPVAAGFVYAKTANDSTPAAQTNSEYALGGSYDLGVAKLFATYQSNKPSNTAITAASKVISFSAVAPVGPGAAVFSYAKNDIAVASGATSANASGLTLGYLYDLSKTTTVYAAYSSVSQDKGTRAYSVNNNALAAATLDLGGSSTEIALGLRKKF